MIKFIFAVLAVILIPLNSSICELVYPNNINSWWMLRLNIYSIIFLLLFIIHQVPSDLKLEKYFKFVVYVGVGFTCSDVVDRWFLNIDCFTWNDVVMVGMVLLIGYRKYLCQITTLKF